jgi:hypothetical protein
VLVLGAIGMASTLQAWYARIYEQPPPKGLLRHVVYQVVGVVAFTVYISVELELFDKVRPVGGRPLIFLLTFVLAALFWWCSAYFILYRQVALRRLLPAGIATGACLTGLGVVSSFLFSDQVTSGKTATGLPASSWRWSASSLDSVSVSTRAQSSVEFGTTGRTNAPRSATKMAEPETHGEQSVRREMPPAGIEAACKSIVFSGPCTHRCTHAARSNVHE